MEGSRVFAYLAGMKRWILCAAVGAALCGRGTAQEAAVLRAAMYLSGAASEEEVPEAYVLLVESASRIQLNAPRLRPGLLSDYQIASIYDYRAAHGDILSAEELALVDGFSADAVAALAPFLSFASGRLPGHTDTARVQAKALVRSTLTSVGGKARVNGGNWQAGGAWRGSGGSFFAEGTFSRAGRVLAGDFHLRYGQGLAAWSGFALTSLSTVDAFVLRPGGATPSWSYTPSVHRGLAYEYGTRHFRGSAFATLAGSFGTHADALWRRGQVGLTLLREAAGPFCLSVDGRYNGRGVLLVGETAFRNGQPSGKAAVQMPLGESARLAVQGRFLPSAFSGKKYGEYALAVGSDFQNGRRTHRASLTLDAALLPLVGSDPRRMQLRMYASWQWQFFPDWDFSLRLTERYRNYEFPRTAVRADVRFSSAPWLSVLRAEAVRCEGFGFLSYWEGGYKGASAALYLKLTGFVIDRWNDRIYCYERDAPGTFSVPAYYGRGGAFSATGSWKHRFGRLFTLQLNLRAALQLRRERDPAPTLNIQLQLSR